MEERLITPSGLKKLNDELNERKTIIRQEIAAAIKEAKEQGDLSENAEYSAARARQSENESRIADLEMMVKSARVATANKKSSVVQVGSSVAVRLGKSDMEFHIVGTDEADPTNGKISNESPLGRAFVGKEKGATVRVETPSGVREYEIIEVK